MMTHADHAGLNGRGYRMSGCPECELRYRMAYQDYPPDSATENMAACALTVVVFLLIYALSGYVPLPL